LRGAGATNRRSNELDSRETGTVEEGASGQIHQFLPSRERAPAPGAREKSGKLTGMNTTSDAAKLMQRTVPHVLQDEG